MKGKVMNNRAVRNICTQRYECRCRLFKVSKFCPSGAGKVVLGGFEGCFSPGKRPKTARASPSVRSRRVPDLPEQKKCDEKIIRKRGK